MSHGLVADSVDTVDTSLAATLLHRCTTDAVFSEVHDQCASRERCADALSFCGTCRASCIFLYIR